MTDLVEGPGGSGQPARSDNVAVRHDLAHVPLVDPSADSGLLEVFRQRYLLRLLVRRELAARYLGSVFGFAWSYIQPAIRFCMYFFLVGLVFRQNALGNFGIHLFAGMVLVNYFTGTFNSGTRSIITNKALAQKLALPLEMFPVASMLVSLYHVVPQVIILLVACLAVGWNPDLAGLGAGLLGLTLTLLMGMIMALLFSAWNVYFRDFGKVVATLTSMTHFAVPMMYPYSLIETRFGELGSEIYLWNPLSEAVLLFQRCFWITTDGAKATIAESFPADLFQRGFIMLGACIVLLVVAQKVFTRLEGGIPERLG